MKQSSKAEDKQKENPSAKTGDEKEGGKKEEEKKEEEKNGASEEDIAVCAEILAKTNYYEILGVEKTASEEEIKKQYKKLALKLHPDKNRAPQATEAFKKVAQALACLTNPNKRKIYDEHGNEENFRTQYREYFQDEDELDPEDLFDLLFTGKVNRNRGRRRYNPRREEAGGQGVIRGKYYILMQLLPFVLMIIFTGIMHFRGTPEPGFSLSMNEKYYIKKSIHTSDVDYYVDETYVTQYDSFDKKRELELEVLKAYLEKLYSECVQMKKLRAKLEEAKHQASNQEVVSDIEQKIEELDWTPCRRFEELRRELRSG